MQGLEFIQGQKATFRVLTVSLMVKVEGYISG
jgi:hypothetical protein